MKRDALLDKVAEALDSMFALAGGEPDFEDKESIDNWIPPLEAYAEYCKAAGRKNEWGVLLMDCREALAA